MKTFKRIKASEKTTRILKSFFTITAGLWILGFPALTSAADLVITPANPVLEVGESVQLTVTGAGADVIWSAIKGTISGQGATTTYTAPLDVGIDAVTVISGEDIGILRVTIVPRDSLEPAVSLENANWELFTNRSEKHAQAVSDDGAFLWVGTNGGLEKRDGHTGDLIRIYTTLEGLPHNEVVSLSLDGSGGVWAGTYGGLAHLLANGSWQVFDKNNSGLKSNRIQALALDGSGGVWAGTYDGLAHLLSDGSWQVFDTDNSGLPHGNIQCLAPDGLGGVWVGTYYSLSHLLAGGSWQVLTTDNSELPWNSITSLVPDGSQGLWVGTGKGLAHLPADGSWQVFTTDNSGLPRNDINSLVLDGEGGLWVGAFWSDGVAHLLADGSWQVLDTENCELPDTHIISLAPDGVGGVWVGTYRGLAHLLADGSWHVSDTKHSGLPQNYIKSLALDGTGGLWVGTYGGLGHLLTDGSWQVFDTGNSGLPEDTVASLVLDGSGGLWTGTYGGAAHLLADGTWQVYTTDNSGLPDNNVVSLVPDGSGGLWAGTYDGLAHLLADSSWQVYTTDNSGLPDNDIVSLVPDGSGGLWVGTYGGGLAHLSAGGIWQAFDVDNSGLPADLVLSLCLDGSGGVWVGTGSGGLAHLSADGSWQVFDADNSGLPADNIVSSLALDSSGGLWAGTYGGLAHLSTDGSWQVLDADNSGLPSDGIESLALDGSGGLWVGTALMGLAHLTFDHKQQTAAIIEDETSLEEYLTGDRAAILVHPRGTGTNEYEVQHMASYAYQVLQERDFLNDEIYFLSHMPMVDINGDGFVDRNVVDGPVTALEMAAGATPRDLTMADIQEAFEWATGKGALDQPLVFIFIDHGLTDELRLDPFTNVLSGTQLNSMLDDYQTDTGNPAVVILEACYSGTLVDELSADNRVIITSTGEEKAFYDGGGRISFSHKFFNTLRTGKSFKETFDLVSRTLTTLGNPFVRQIPRLEDSGDGVANTDADGSLARTFCLNGCWTTLAGQISLEPQSQSASVTQGQTIDLSVKVGITEGGIQNVWALVLTPEVAGQRDATGFSLPPAPVVAMSEGEGGVWSGTFSEFYYKGDYVVTFMARDNDGFVETSAPVIFTLNDGLEPPASGVIANGQPPMVSQDVFQTNDRLLVTLPQLPQNKDQYVAITLPGGLFYFLTDMNSIALSNNQTYPVWNGETTAVDLTVTAGFPRGDYMVYLLRMPAGTSPAANSDAWELGMADFEVQ